MRLAELVSHVSISSVVLSPEPSYAHFRLKTYPRAGFRPGGFGQNMQFWGVLEKAREGGIEPGTARFRPPPRRAPSHWANLAREPRLPSDFLCTQKTSPGLAPRAPSHSSPKTRLLDSFLAQNTTFGASGGLISVFLMFLLKKCRFA